MDVDRHHMITGLQRCLHDSGLSQAQLAPALGTSASRFSTYRRGTTIPSATFYLRAVRLATSLGEARRRGWMTPQVTSREIRHALGDGDATWAWKLALQSRDHLREMFDEDGPADAWETYPGSTGHPRWDTLLAAQSAHEFEARGLEAPEWTRSAICTPPWILSSPLHSEDEVRILTPPWLAARGIFVAPRDLATA